MFSQSKSFLSFALTAVLVVSTGAPSFAQASQGSVSQAENLLVGVAQGTLTEEEGLARLAALSLEERKHFINILLQRFDEAEIKLESLEADLDSKYSISRTYISLVLGGLARPFLIGITNSIKKYSAMKSDPLAWQKFDRLSRPQMFIALGGIAVFVVSFGLYGWNQESIKVTKAERDQILAETRSIKALLRAGIVTLENKMAIGD